MSKQRTITVLGGGGYLGNILCRQLLNQGYVVRCFDIFLFGEEPIADLLTHPRFICLRGDIRDRAALEPALEGADAVMHLASFVGDGSCNVHPELTASINYEASRLIAELCPRVGVRRLLFSSTCSVYGGSSEIVTEDSPTDDSTPYTRTKLAAEGVFLAAASDSFHPTILRLSTVFGLSPRMRFDLAVNIMVAQAEMQRRISVFNGQRWRPFIHTTDVARAFVHVFHAPLAATSGRIFNVGSSSMNLTIGDLGRRIARYYPDLEMTEAANADGRDYNVDFSRFEALGFRCKVSLEEGIQEIGAFVRKRRPNLAEARYNNGLMTKEKLCVLLCDEKTPAYSSPDEPARDEQAPEMGEVVRVRRAAGGSRWQATS